MPRVSDEVHYGRYYDMYYVWHRFRNLFGVLSEQEQRDVIAYYLPVVQLTQAEYRIHREIMDKKEPELAAKAGKLYAKLTRTFEVAIKGTNGSMERFNENLRPFLHKDNLAKLTRQKPGRKRLQRVSIRAERREEVDWDKFAYALLQYTKIKMQREKEEKDAG